MSTKHTPGPWYIVGERDLVERGIDDLMICSQVGPDRTDEDLFITNIGEQIGPLSCDEARGAVNLANARLIAAAPDLLDALRALVDSDGLTYLHEHDDYGNLLVCNHCNEWAQVAAEIAHEDHCIVGKARAAIAKAEGR